MVYCADCGSKMQYGSSNHRDFSQDFFDCSLHKKNGSKCKGHFIRVKVLEGRVLSHVQRVTDYILRHEDYFRKVMEEQLRVESTEKLTVLKKQLARNEKRIADLKRLFMKIYEDNASGKLSDERFDMMSQGATMPNRSIWKRKPYPAGNRSTGTADRKVLRSSSRKRTNTFILKNSPLMLSVNWCRPSMWMPRISPAESGCSTSISSTMGWGTSLWMNWKQKKRRDRSHAKSSPFRELLQILFYGNSANADLILNGEPEKYLRNVAGSHGLED